MDLFTAQGELFEPSEVERAPSMFRDRGAPGAQTGPAPVPGFTRRQVENFLREVEYQKQMKRQDLAGEGIDLEDL